MLSGSTEAAPLAPDYGLRLPSKSSFKTRWSVQTRTLGELQHTKWGRTPPKPHRLYFSSQTPPAYYFEKGLTLGIEAHPTLALDELTADAIYGAALSGDAAETRRAVRALKQRYEAALAAEVERRMTARKAQLEAEKAKEEEQARRATSGAKSVPTKPGKGAPGAQEAEAAAASAAEEARARHEAEQAARRAVHWALYDRNVGREPLIALCAARGFSDVVSALLEAGHWVHATSDGGVHALVRAAGVGDAASVDCLLAHGATIEKATAEGTTAVHAAAAHGQLVTFERLLEAEDSAEAEARAAEEAQARGQSEAAAAAQGAAADGAGAKRGQQV